MDTNHDLSQFASDKPDNFIDLEIDNLSQLAEYADPNCTRAGCYGRGYTGFFQPKDTDRHLPILCKCVKNVPRKRE